MNTQNSQRRIGRVAATIAVLGLVALGTVCSGEDLAENIAERQIEQETGEDVDIDLNGECVSIQTEEGSMTCDENGNMVIQSPDGSAVVNVDDGSLQVSGADGEDISINADADGNIQASSEDGTYTASASSELPDEFPSDIAIPDGFTVESSAVMGDATMSLISLGLGTDASVEDAGAALAASLEAAGYERQSFVDQAGMLYVTYAKGEEMVTLTVADQASSNGLNTTISLTVQAAP